MGNKTYIAGIDIGVRTLFPDRGLCELFLRIKFLKLISRGTGREKSNMSINQVIPIAFQYQNELVAHFAKQLAQRQLCLCVNSMDILIIALMFMYTLSTDQKNGIGIPT